MSHISVLLHESIDGLALRPGMTIVDATFGNGGHSREILKRLNSDVKIIALDLDPTMLARGKENFKDAKDKIIFEEASFRDIDTVLAKHHVSEVQGVLYDLGLNSLLLEESNKGFSFQKEEPLIMTFSDNAVFTAGDIVNDWSEETIANILYGYADERYARRIAKAICDSRREKPIKTTTELREIIFASVPAAYRHGRIHPATKTFQALRIAVNDELTALTESLKKSFAVLSRGDRIAAISFHSLEDKIVKHFFKDLKENGQAIIITKKPITPSKEELISNPRSRSAKLRIVQKI
jgi:16S rRNA (cytosine1402-N4)-methyltransferase